MPQEFRFKFVSFNEYNPSIMGSQTVPVVKMEPTESAMLPFTNARSRENIISRNADEPPLPRKVVKTESQVVKMEDIETERVEPVKKEEPEPAKPAGHQGVPGIPTIYTTYKAPEEIQYTPEGFLQEGIKMVKNIKAHVKRLELGNKLRKDVWLREIASLETQCSPSTMIAVCGATGAGKSSALNAILDDNIVPTSGMRACTAVVTEISYHKNKTIEADVSFLSEKEWRDELEVLLDDLLDEDGQFRRTTDLRSEAGVAWHKVHALYPTLTQDRLVTIARRAGADRIDAILKVDPKILQLMGSTKKIVTNNSREFSKEIAKYIDSKDQKRGEKKDKEKKDKGPALWPLIRQVNVRCNSHALSTGAVLVDLPGVADANAARSSIARDYMKKANCIWILAPITRAVDDKTAKDLLGDAFKSQLMNGSFADVESTITFIATKCDDISCSEVIGSLSLEDDPVLEEIEERISQVRSGNKEWKQKKTDAEKAAKRVTEELRTIREDIAEHNEHLKALEEGRTFTPKKPEKNEKNAKKRKNSRGGKSGSPKRRREDFEEEEEEEMALDPDADEDSDLDDFIDDSSIKNADSDNEDQSGSDADEDNKSDDESQATILAVEGFSVDDIKAKIEEKKGELKNARERLSESRRLRKEASDMLANLKEKQDKAQKDKNAFCSSKRSEFSRDVLKEDFRCGLKELDDAVEEKRNPTGFNPFANLRDYESINLPVFTVSSRDYIRITKQVRGDGEPSCFSNVEETGIPELQQWCHTLTIKSRERSAKSFRNHLKVFATSIKSYIDSFDAVSEADREALRQKWDSDLEDDLYTINSDSDDRYSYDDDDDDEFDWIYERGKLSKVPKAQGSQPRANETSTARRRNGPGISGRLSDEFHGVIASSVRGMQRWFKDGLEEKCQTGADAAANTATETSDAFAASMHWATYRATLRREGVWRRNLNEELLNPMTRTIASSWAKTFENNLFADFETKTLAAISELVEEVEKSCPDGLSDRAHHQGQLCLEEVKVTLKTTIDVVSEGLTSGQKEVSRCLEPHVRDQLSDGYYRAIEERGRGSVARQKAVFRNYVDTNKDDLFEHGADIIIQKLDKVAEDVGKALKESMANLAEQVEVNLAVLWETASNNTHLIKERAEAVACVNSILQQLTLWEIANGLKKGLKVQRNLH